MNRKHGALAVVVVLAIPLAVAAVAFACGSLATLKLNRASAPPGAEVTARGGNFNSSPRASTVQIRFNSRNGRVLWEGRPNVNGRLTATFHAPDAAPGHYVIVATQTGPDGRPAAGTPGRAPLRMRRASTSRSSSIAPMAPVAAPSRGDGPPPQSAPVGLIGVGLLVAGLAGGAALASLGRRRRRHVDIAGSLS